MLDVEDEDEEGKDAETSDQGGPTNATDLNKAYLSNCSSLLFFWKRNKYNALWKYSMYISRPGAFFRC